MNNLWRRVFIIFTGVIMLYISSPLLFPIAMGGVLAVLFYPWLNWLEKKKIPTWIGSAILTFGITVVLILPLSFLISFATKSGFQSLQDWKKTPRAGGDWLNTVLEIPYIQSSLVWFTDRTPFAMADILRAIHDLTGSIRIWFTELLGEVLAHLPGTLIALMFVVLSVYFFLLDGKRLVRWVRGHSLFTRTETDKLMVTVAGMCRSVILAAVISGLIQAFVEMTVCGLTLTPNVGMIGVFTFISSFIPIVGSAPVTLIVGFQQFLEGRELPGFILMAMAFVLLAIDNGVRPWFLKGTTNLHPFLAFVAAFGGLKTLGFFGIFLGPILAALFVATLEVFAHD